MLKNPATFRRRFVLGTGACCPQAHGVSPKQRIQCFQLKTSTSFGINGSIAYQHVYVHAHIDNHRYFCDQNKFREGPIRAITVLGRGGAKKKASTGLINVPSGMSFQGHRHLGACLRYQSRAIPRSQARTNAQSKHTHTHTLNLPRRKELSVRV